MGKRILTAKSAKNAKKILGLEIKWRKCKIWFSHKNAIKIDEVINC